MEVSEVVTKLENRAYNAMSGAADLEQKIARDQR
jgi:hypothetical protein